MLNRLAEYAKLAGLTPEPGFAARPVHWVLEIAANGEPRGFMSMSESKGRKNVPRTIHSAPEMPNSLLRTGERCHFLLESLSVVLNLPAKPDETEKIARKHAYFVDMVKDAASHEKILDPVATFYSCQDFLERARSEAQSKRIRAVDNVSFAVNGQLLLELPQWRGWWAGHISGLSGGGAATPSAVDILTGQPCVPLKTHAPVKGLAGAGGRATTFLISFDKPAFNSYGFEQGQNAPLTDRSGRAYVDALNKLILEQAVALGDIRVLHWYDGRLEPENDIFAMLSDPPEAKELDALDRCRKLLNAIRSGEREDLGRHRYYAMGVSGSGARVMVRFWMEGGLEDLVEKTDKWLEATSMVMPDGRIRSGFSLRRLAEATIPPQRERDSGNVQERRIALALLTAALRNAPIPDAVAVAALDRIRAEAASLERGESEMRTSHRPTRMALLKAYVNRHLAKKGDTSMNVLKAELDEASPHIGYHCGRLMAALAEIQRRALGDVGAGVVQRYYAAASATPALVFGRLLRGAQYHLGKLEPGLTWYFDDILGKITESIGPSMPSTLDLEGQTLFALGYYHQLAGMRAKAKEASARKAEAMNSDSETIGEENNA